MLTEERIYSVKVWGKHMLYEGQVSSGKDGGVGKSCFCLLLWPHQNDK